jgi:hypothetical protein
VEADEDTDPKVDGDAGTGPEASSVVKPKHKTRAAAAKQSASTVAAKVAAVKTAKLEAEKKKRKRKTSPPPAVETLVIPTLSTREVESDDEEEDEATDGPPIVEERTVRRSLSHTAKRQRELQQKTTEDDLCQGLEAQRAAATAQAKIPVLIKAQTFRPKPRVPTTTR